MLLARALAAKGLNEAALAACKEALLKEARQRDAHRRPLRPCDHLRAPRQARRKDLELIYASEPGYRDVRQRLEGHTA